MTIQQQLYRQIDKMRRGKEKWGKYDRRRRKKRGRRKREEEQGGRMRRRNNGIQKEQVEDLG